MADQSLAGRCDHNARQRHGAGLAHRLVQHQENVMLGFLVPRHLAGGVEEAWVDQGGIAKPADHLIGRPVVACLREVRVFQQNGVILSEFVTLRRILPINLLVGFRVLRHHADAAAGLRVVRRKCRPPPACTTLNNDGAGLQRQARMSAPDGFRGP